MSLVMAADSRCRWGDVDARAKLAGVFAGVLALSLAASGRVLAVQLVGVLVLFACSQMPLKWLLQRCALVTPMAGGMAALLAFELGPNYEPSLLVLGKAYGSVVLLGILVASTPLPRLIAGMEGLRLPGVLVMTASFTHRYAQLLEEEWKRVARARACRAGATGGEQAWGSRLGGLFLRSWDRAERVAGCMAARGFTGQRGAAGHPPMAAKDWLFLGAMALFAAPLASTLR